MSSEAFFAYARRAFYKELQDRKVLTMNSKGVASNADKDSFPSTVCARHLGFALGTKMGGKKSSGQTLGVRFEEACENFIRTTFLELAHLRPGCWTVERVKGRRLASGVARFAQYKHLVELDHAVNERASLQSVIGNDYAIAPDVVVFREPVLDAEINKNRKLVDDTVSTRSTLRDRSPILHAVVSCKWTLRSDRAQNARSEALNLIRNRKGQLPHVAVVTAEPIPKRISSLALGTGDIDCVYHFALPELVNAVRMACDDKENRLLSTMVEGGRLKDITDLAVDLAS